MVRLHRGSPQVASYLLDERWRVGLKRALHHRLRVMREGQRAAVETPPSVDQPLFSLGTLNALYPIWAYSGI
ncbi:MAG: hypothetical protein ABR905_08165 [Terracidiphilus sp.]